MPTSPKIEVFATVENGELKGFNRKYFSQMLSQFEGKDVELIVQAKKRRRSQQQSRYYWGVIVTTFQQLIHDATGEYLSKDDVHEFLKRKFNYVEIVNSDGGIVEHIGKSTANLSTLDFEDYQDKCRDFASEFFNAFIPLPGEQAEIMI